MSLKNEIIQWANRQPYWFKYASNLFLEGSDVAQQLVDKTYEYFLEVNSLKEKDDRKPEIVFQEIELESNTEDDGLKLLGIKNIDGVNALAQGHSIEINPNLTIIFGANGAGKSGYVRLLNNAFNSRGDKRLLKNIYKNAITGTPSCVFTFKSVKGTYDLLYPTQKTSREFSQFCVFDGQTAHVLLEQDNRLDFTPHGFEYFENLLNLFEALKKKLAQDISENQPKNDFEKFFQNENAIKTEVASLSGKTNVEVISALASYTPEDEIRLTSLGIELAALRALNIAQQVADLQALRKQIREFTEKIQAVINTLTKAEIERQSALIASFHRYTELSKAEGVKSLEDYSIEGLGSIEWKNFLKAAKEYSTAIELLRDEVTYPSETDACIFCMQPLAENERTLIFSYWNFLKSEAEAELNKTMGQINTAIHSVKTVTVPKFNEDTLIYKYINRQDAPFALRWHTTTLDCEVALKNILENLEKRNWDLLIDPISPSVIEFDAFINQIGENIEQLEKKDPVKEIGALEDEIKLLTDKSLLKKLLPEILTFIQQHKWSAYALKCSAALNTKPITIKQGELFKTYINDRYKELFSEECKNLNAPLVVNIVQKNEKITSLRKLQIQGVMATSVLSEGEQRAVSLADFLTEAQLNPRCKGVFFDDPVNSLDHHRREQIAKRLVDLANNKQVIIFTHDIAFLLQLKQVAEVLKVQYTFTTNRNIGGMPGIIKPDLPWIAQNVKARVGVLKERLVRLKKTEKEGDPDEYLIAAKTWYNLLRETWERAIEERLFKGVVERFNIGIQSQRMKNIVVTTELINQIEKGMTDSSSWLHDAAPGLNPTPPDTNKAEENLKFLEDFQAKCLAS